VDDHTPASVKAVVDQVVGQYKALIEENGMWTTLYDDKKYEDKLPLHEHQAQKIFYGIASSYCNANRLDISPETNSGHGPIDFKISYGKPAKILVEIKLTSNPQIDHGLNVQLPKYESAEKPYATYLIVVSVSHPERNYLEKLTKAIVEKDKNKAPLPEIIYINGNKQKPASKA
jgi:hypothetical protein